MSKNVDSIENFANLVALNRPEMVDVDSNEINGSSPTSAEKPVNTDKSAIDVLMVYPRLGGYDSFIMDLPLSIIYAAAETVKRGYNLKAVDLRCEEGDWQDAIKSYLDQGVGVVGISVMTGTPLKNAREISLFVREHYPQTKILWGGPHCTVVPNTIEEPFIDFLIRGYGSAPLADLVEIMRSGNTDPAEYTKVEGLSFKVDGKVQHVARPTDFEQLHYSDIPYHLIDVKSPYYVRSYNGNKMFSIFTSVGCPYKCTFCVSPATFKEINGKHWLPNEDEEVLDHMEFIIKNYDVNHICFIDDTSFPKIDRMRRIFEAMIERGIKATLEFRGARVNEINKMDDDFLDLMARAGGRFLMCGVESGSDRVLKTAKNGQDRKMIEEVNRKLARHPELVVHFNFIYGTPSERLEDLEQSKELQLQIVKDNPNARIGYGGDWKPIPGTVMLEEAERDHGYQVPQTLDEWIQMDSTDSDEKITHSWYTKKHNQLIKLLQISSFVIDGKMIKETVNNNTPGMRFIRFLARIYRPLAIMRMKYKFYGWLFEYELYQFFSRQVVPRLNLTPKQQSTQDIRGV
jgi:anaerobic magnesium-protoporphyrin IX monomethyl ester cyclase